MSRRPANGQQPVRMPAYLALSRDRADASAVTREPLEKNQQIVLAQLQAQNARWSARPLWQRVLLTLLAIVGIWAVEAGVGWLLSLKIGVSSLGIGFAACLAIALAIPLTIRMFWPDALLILQVRALVPTQKLMESGPWMAFGDTRPQDVRKRPSDPTSAELDK